MNNCPNCLASNPFKKVYRDGLVFVKCEFCNTIFEDTSTRKARESELSGSIRNEVQNKAPDEKDFLSFGMFIFIITILGISVSIIDAIFWSD
ncbi:hypothetical protein D0439_10255 [Lysinibacillus fusiformis]|uniref:hypothetical protein n=1 Tax=Lysinibacillus fusiformis TaxID=28031 RepID=UPI0011BBA623|nr:hypothetical protein [Lysinibacillus fusiformis]QDZ98990.1 hypothetical protein D0439_10255 [Lysinibacillus fusiformis]